MMIPFRLSLTRTILAAGALLALGLGAAQAQDSGVAAPAPAGSDVIETVAAVVYGVSANDLLNVRATASPIGLVLARIPNGTIVTRLECSIVRSAEWCRIEVPDLDGLVGWAPSRYLLSPRDDEAVAEAPAAPPRPVVVDPSQVTIGILPDPLPMPEDPLADLAPGGSAGAADIQTVLIAPAPGGPPTLDAAREAAKVEGAAADLALAFATRTDPASSEVYSAFAAEAAPGAGEAETSVESAVPVPVPSPRPPRADEQDPAPAEAVAALPSAGTATTQAPAAEPAGQAAPAADEPESPVAVTPQATLPAPEAAASAAPDVGPAAEAPAVPAPAQQPAVALAPPPAAPGDPAPESPVVPEPEAAGASPDPAAMASPEPAGGPAETGEAPRTLREQLAALLPAWSRPQAGDGAEPAPETEPATPVPAAPSAVASDGDTAEAAAAPAAAESTEQMAAVRPAEPSAGAAVPSAAGAETGSARSGDEADAAGTPPAVDQAAAVPPPSDGARTTVAEAATAEPPSTLPAPPVVGPAPVPVVPAPMPVAPQPAEEASRAETLAEAQPAMPVQSASPAAEGETAEIPCARYVGQPMTRCAVRILRLAADDADVTVLWPDGGERLIRFRGGEPDGTSGRGEFRFTREAELNLIRIGSGERFEILDAVPFSE